MFRSAGPSPRPAIAAGGSGARRLAYTPGRVDLDEFLIDQLGGDARITASGWRETDARGPGRTQVQFDAVNLP